MSPGMKPINEPDFSTTFDADGAEVMGISLRADETLAVFILQLDGGQFGRWGEDADIHEIADRLRDLAERVEEGWEE